MRFYLGAPEPHWLGLLDVPMFVSYRRLRLQLRTKIPKARVPWAMDSGGFTELGLYGKWKTSVDEYIEGVNYFATEIGQLEWAAPQDWMCEPDMLEKTGLSVREHQERTVDNYLLLRDKGPFIPVLQGWEIDDYLECIDLYAQAGVELGAEPVVGIGSVCRRQNDGRTVDLFNELVRNGIRSHGFGVKVTGLAGYGDKMVSADSMAWTVTALYRKPLPGCSHKHCTACIRYAVRWWSKVVGDYLAPN